MVTPVFNGARFLAGTLASVRAQQYPNLEYIVCDGGSTDGTHEILAAHRDLISHLIVEPDRGMYDALMKGFRRATGQVFGWLNADDMMMPWCLSCVGAYFMNVPRCRWVTGIPSMYDELGRLVWTAQIAPRYRRSWIRRRWYSSIGLGPIQQEGTFFRRDLFEQAGGLDCSLRLAGDFDLWCRFARHADLHQLGTVISGFRSHAANASGNQAAYWQEARAVKIPGGKVLGAFYSFFSFLQQRARKHPRLDHILFDELRSRPPFRTGTAPSQKL